MLWLELCRPHQRFQPTGLDADAPALFLGNIAGSAAAEPCYLAFKRTYAGFARIRPDDLTQRFVADAELVCAQPVLLALLRQKVALRYLKLLLIGVACKLYDLHTVEQRSGYGVKRVRGGDEEHLGQVEGYLKEIIPKCGVLLAVERFEQRRRRVAPIVGAKLVYFVKHHERVAALGLNDAVYDAAGHGAYVGLAVAAYLGLVMHTAERYAHELAVHRLGDAHGDAGLAGARRADKADKATLDIRAELLDGKVFYDAILDLLKAEVLIVEELSGFFKVDGLRGLLAPRQLKAGIEIAAQDCRLGRAEGLLHQARQLLIELLLDLVGRGKRADFPAVFADIVRLPVLAELRLNYLHLLA